MIFELTCGLGMNQKKERRYIYQSLQNIKIICSYVGINQF